jgi:hypothetical protein
VVALVALTLATVGAVGCGEEEGVAEGAVVRVFVEAPLCGAEAATPSSWEVGNGEQVKVRFVCLHDPVQPGLSQGVGGGPRQLDLALVGENARRATQDSASIAYVEARDPAVNRFTEPILEAAGIGWLRAETRPAAVRELRAALASADPSSLRADVRAALGR